jgi:hypothetical protein
MAALEGGLMPRLCKPEHRDVSGRSATRGKGETEVVQSHAPSSRGGSSISQRLHWAVTGGIPAYVVRLLIDLLMSIDRRPSSQKRSGNNGCAITGPHDVPNFTDGTGPGIGGVGGASFRSGCHRYRRHERHRESQLELRRVFRAVEILPGLRR